jgi:hypothetical protein
MATVTANQYSLLQDFDPNNDLAKLETVAPGVTKIVESQNRPGEPWYQTLERALTGLTATYYQTEILKVNIDRAKIGLPPITGTDVPATTVAVGLSRDTQNLLLILGGGLLLGLLLLRGK